MEPIASVLRGLDADIVGLQEVLSSEQVPQPGQLERLADATGRVAVAGATLVEEDTRYGNGLLLRHPPLEVRRHDLSVPGAEPRGALEVVLDGRRLTPAWPGPVRVVTTHLGLRRRERGRQIARLVELVSESNPAPLLALMGDTNEWRPRPFPDPLRVLEGPLLPVPIRRTFPARSPLVALDRIWVDPGAQLLHSGVERGREARRASDHLPVFADVVPGG